MSLEETVKLLQAEVQMLKDKDALTSLLNTYCRSGDEHDWQTFADCFVEEGCLLHYEGWGPIEGRENIIKTASTAEDRFEGLQHMLTNYEFQIDGDTATGTSGLWFAATPKIDKPEDNYAWGGSYRWLFVRTPKGWKIHKMNLKRVWSMGHDSLRQWT